GTVSLFIGIPVAIAMNLWRITRLGWRRHGGSLDGLIALEVAPLHLAVIVVALLVGGVFVAHLAVDAYACMSGARPARRSRGLRRTAFGYSRTQLETALSDGFDKTVDRLIESKPAEPPPLEAATTPGGRFPITQLQQWWINHMLTTQTPFAERMTLFWHGHFTSDYRKAADNTFMYWQNLTWRRMAMTDLPAMLLAVTTDPATLRYLDLATSTGQNPNENYSRELMELFTMGPGNFTEQDVREGPKALAGWQLPKPDSIATV